MNAEKMTELRDRWAIQRTGEVAGYTSDEVTPRCAIDDVALLLGCIDDLRRALTVAHVYLPPGSRAEQLADVALGQKAVP